MVIILFILLKKLKYKMYYIFYLIIVLVQINYKIMCDSIINQTIRRKFIVNLTILSALTRYNQAGFDNGQHINDDDGHWIWSGDNNNVYIQCVHCKSCGNYYFSNTIAQLLSINPPPRVLNYIECQCVNGPVIT